MILDWVFLGSANGRWRFYGKMMEDVDPFSIWDGHGGNPGVPETGIVFVIHNMS